MSFGKLWMIETTGRMQCLPTKRHLAVGAFRFLSFSNNGKAVAEVDKFLASFAALRSEVSI